jgi:hypothetical protein
VNGRMGNGMKGERAMTDDREDEAWAGASPSVLHSPAPSPSSRWLIALRMIEQVAPQPTNFSALWGGMVRVLVIVLDGSLEIYFLEVVPST